MVFELPERRAKLEACIGLRGICALVIRPSLSCTTDGVVASKCCSRPDHYGWRSHWAFDESLSGVSWHLCRIQVDRPLTLVHERFEPELTWPMSQSRPKKFYWCPVAPTETEAAV